jgi:hypothetical protein
MPAVRRKRNPTSARREAHLFANLGTGAPTRNRRQVGPIRPSDRRRGTSQFGVPDDANAIVPPRSPEFLVIPTAQLAEDGRLHTFTRRPFASVELRQ